MSNTGGARAYNDDFASDHDALMMLPAAIRQYLQFQAEENYSAKNALMAYRQGMPVYAMMDALREVSHNDHHALFPGLSHHERTFTRRTY